MDPRTSLDTKERRKISTPPTPGIEPGPSSPQPSALPLEPPGPSPPHWCSWYFFRTSKVCSNAKERVGKQRVATEPIQSLVKLQCWFMSLRWKTCLRQCCKLGSYACIERPALGQNTLLISLYCLQNLYMPETTAVKGVDLR